MQYILDSLLNALEDDENRLFSYGEMSYFQRWYFDISPQKRERVKRVVANGQLNFVNGGWVMHDEAAAHYVSMIDHTTHGHRFLKDEFDFKPRVGWQLDPFGHSSTQAALLCHAAGFDGLFFGRIDYQVLVLRHLNAIVLKNYVMGAGSRAAKRVTEPRVHLAGLAERPGGTGVHGRVPGRKLRSSRQPLL